MSIAKTCKVSDCDGLGDLAPNGNRCFVKGYCIKHYKNLWRYGDPLHYDNRKYGVIRLKCKVEYCDNGDNFIEKTYLIKGYCTKHYAQVRKHGKTFLTDKDKRPAIIKGNIALIPIGFKSRYGYATVDKAFSWLDKYVWTNHNGYAITTVNGKQMRMHHFVLERKNNLFTDHINRDRSDNRTCNLRYATRQENTYNSVRKSASGYKGVIFNKRINKWQAVLRGSPSKSFVDIEDAAMHYNEMAMERYGEFAALNIIMEN